MLFVVIKSWLSMRLSSNQCTRPDSEYILLSSRNLGYLLPFGTTGAVFVSNLIVCAIWFIAF